MVETKAEFDPGSPYFLQTVDKVGVLISDSVSLL